MEMTATVSARDMAPAARDWIAGVLHVELADSDECTLTLRRSAVAAHEQRLQAWSTIRRILAKAADNLKQVPEAEFDDALDEAVRTVRPRARQAQ
jgi:hypothetical protein